jgi:transcriptional regulator with XRE-family HTH domain
MPISKKEYSKLIGNRIRKIRTEKNITIETLAFDADMEYKQLSRIELGEINTTLFQIYKISNALNISESEITSNLVKS